MLPRVIQYHLFMLQIGKPHLPRASGLVPISLIDACGQRVSAPSGRAMGLGQPRFDQGFQRALRLRRFALNMDGQFVGRQPLQATQRSTTC